MVSKLWCRVTIVDAEGATLAQGMLEGPADPDLRAVDDLARLMLQAKRLGGGIQLAEVSPELCALLELAGLRVEMEG
jgi:hypothetical protein